MLDLWTIFDMPVRWNTTYGTFTKRDPFVHKGYPTSDFVMHVFDFHCKRALVQRPPTIGRDNAPDVGFNGTLRSFGIVAF